MTVRGRIRSLTESAGAVPTRRTLADRAVATPSPRLADHPEPANRPAAGDTFEWDMRKSDGPTDAALYDCACGYKFTARVATTVSCPNCGTGQAW
jgi:hypothetical protein